MKNNIFQKSDFGILNAQLRNNFYKKYPYLWQGLQCKKLYHYTDLTAFKSILENKSLWMSNPKYLNDSEEFIEGKNKVIKFIECYISRNKKISPNFIEILEEVKIKIAEDNCFDKEFFISSFSTIKDDLSQWRAYGKDGEGICLELDNFGRSQFHALTKVIYKSSEKYRLIHYILYRYSSEFHKNNETNYHNDYVNSLIDDFSELFPVFKNEAFESEHEVRLIFDRSKFIKYEMSNVKRLYRVSNNLLLPYIDTSDLFWEIEDIKKPMIDIKVSKVTLGPTTKHKELTKQSIEDFLQEKGFIDTKVEFSKLPYR